MQLKSKALTFIVALVVVGLVVVQKLNRENLNQRVAHLSEQAEMLNAAAQIDKMWGDNMKKVLSVLNRYNPAMSLEQKLAIANEITEASFKYSNLDVDLICATITHESAFTWDPQVVSKAGAMGLMQVMPATGKFLAKIEGVEWTSADDVLFDPVLNIRLGSRYLSSLIELYDIDGGLAAYNGGNKRVQMWLAQNKANGVLYQETEQYVPAVLSLYEEFRAN